MSAAENSLEFVWLEITGKCNERCVTCYADSSPKGDHGSMKVADWKRVISQAKEMGVKDVQFIGGEPTLHPGLPQLIAHAAHERLGIEVFSNLTHIREGLWETFKECGAKLATSYYSDKPEEHDGITRMRGSHKRTRANIEKALTLGIPIRGGIISVTRQQRASEAARELLALGMEEVGGDTVRAFGRGGGGGGGTPRVEDLCGHCAHEKCAVGPNGDVWPCVLGRFLVLGNVRTTPLTKIWMGEQMAAVSAEITAVHGEGRERCTPPQFLPMCGPCAPCVPSVGHCDPKKAGGESGAATIAASA